MENLEAGTAEGSEAGTEAPVKSSSLVSEQTYSGYGGWLRFFCIIQIYIQPASTLIFGVFSLANGGETPFSLQLLLFAGSLAVAGFGAVIGVWLRRLEPAAVRVAKVYLVIRVIWTAVALAVPAVLFWTDTYDLAAPVYVLATTLAWSALWFTYFSISKRIKISLLAGQA